MSFPFFTYGGLFYWIDKYSYAGWRVQESMWTHRCRLLDPFNVKRCAGSFEQCHNALFTFQQAWEVPSPPKKAVVFIHGLFQRPSSFEKIARYFQKDYEPIVFSYPTLRFSLAKSAQILNALLEHRKDLEQINFVAYGTGGLILRQIMGENPSWKDKIGRSVFLATPHRGYSWAEKWNNKKWYRLLLGEAGQSILPEIAKKLPLPSGDFGVIIAGKDDEKGVLPLFKEDNDGILPVKEAHCIGAKEEFMALNKTHFFLHQDDKLIEMAHSFLSTGRFGRGVRIRKEQNYSSMWEN
ncbi:MAG: hypothetical protein J5787_02860 [Alphaproteobacteria bacterium]|nr:hypothetical protein [Alphaproteobacteria bacterium]